MAYNWLTRPLTTLNFSHTCTSCDTLSPKMSTECFLVFGVVSTNLPVAPNRFVSLYWAQQWLPLSYVDNFVDGCVFLCVCVCVFVKSACVACVFVSESFRVCKYSTGAAACAARVCACTCSGVTHGCKWLGHDRMWLNVCVWQACCGGGVCNVNKQEQQQ